MTSNYELLYNVFFVNYKFGSLHAPLSSTSTTTHAKNIQKHKKHKKFKNYILRVFLACFFVFLGLTQT